ncbi:hypothetical protein HPB47_006169 [Ixodes persulcatus]|uniref:Uncharacterized protein n=1 Tax=Ixodes persulcatus TaxID=34615 RepID=A0AC60PAZ4_IXOPE|nr:hypothetical protein HPB47_006169 [Ixodes persulcatus]
MKRVVDEQSRTMQQLQSDLNDVQQFTSRSSLEIQGVLSSKNENLAQIVNDLAAKLELPALQQGDVNELCRLPPKSSPSAPILIRFTLIDARERWMSRRNKLRELPRSDAFSKVFLNEHLSRANKELFWRARNWSWNLGLFRSSHQLSNRGPFKEILASPLSDRWPPCKDQTPSWISRPAKTSGHSLLGSASSPCDHRFSLTQSAQPPSSEPSDGIEPRLRLHPVTIGINGPWLLLAFELESATSSQVEPSDSLAQLSMVHQKLDLLLSLKETVESLKELHPKVDSLLSLRQTVDTMRDTIATMQESLTFFSSEYDILVKATASQDKAIKELQSETITLRSTVLEQAREIQKLKADQNDTDQASRLCNMEIHGIPFSPRENLVDLMTGLAGKLNIESFQLADVVAAHRLPAKPGTVPPLLIRTLDVVSWTAGLP